MQPFRYLRPADEARASAAATIPGTSFLAGGTTLVDLMRLGVQQPEALIDLGGLPLKRLSLEKDGLHVGALVTNSELATHKDVKKQYPALSQALLSGASPQLRNMASVGGNLLQRTRCPYFRDVGASCNKRNPGSRCSGWGGYNRSHAILGGSENCIAVNPSDMTVALLALSATLRVRGPRGERTIPVGELHLIPEDHPQIETVLQPGELITEVLVPASSLAARSVYVKARDRASFAFALASAAVALEIKSGSIAAARVALGGVATKPWRALASEQVLVGGAPSSALFKQAAAAAVRDAQPRPYNAFKIELVQRTLVRALETAGGMA